MASMTRRRGAAYFAAMVAIVTFGWAAYFVWDNGGFLAAAIIAFAMVYGSYYGEAAH